MLDICKFLFIFLLFASINLIVSDDPVNTASADTNIQNANNDNNDNNDNNELQNNETDTYTGVDNDDQPVEREGWQVIASDNPPPNITVPTGPTLPKLIEIRLGDKPIGSKPISSKLTNHLTAAVLPGKDMNEKKLNLKQINEKHMSTRVALHQTIEAIYNCTQDSVLSILTMRTDFDNYLTCNQVLDIKVDTTLNATIRVANNQTTPVTAYDSNVQIVFFRGNQMYYTSARIDSGYCEGDKITILNVGMARKGGCNARSGVRQVVSEYAQLTIAGNCRSTCFGDVQVSITPGVRNY